MKGLVESFINANSIKNIAIGDYYSTAEQNIIIAAVISILKNHSWLETSTFQKKIRNIQYDDILNILNTSFNKKYTIEDLKRGKGIIMKVIQKNKEIIESLVNGKIYKELNGKEIKEKYKDLIRK